MKVRTSEIVSVDEDGENPVVREYDVEVPDEFATDALNRRDVTHKLHAAFDSLQQILDTPGPFTAAQATAAIKSLARTQRHLLRATVNRFDGAD